MVAYRDQLITRWKDGAAAAEALRRGEVAGAAGMASELESVLAADERFVIEPLPVPRMRNGWAVGMAVKKDAMDVAQALQKELNQIAASGELRRIFETAAVSWRQP